MNAYEITLIVRPDLDDEQTHAVTDQITSRLESAGGEMIAAYPWSPPRRRMAYEIRDFGDGYYFTATFRLDPPALREFENTLKLNDRVLRFLVVRATDQQIKQSQQRMRQQAAPAVSAPQGPPEEAAAETLPADQPAPEQTETPPQEEPIATAAVPSPSETEE